MRPGSREMERGRDPSTCRPCGVTCRSPVASGRPLVARPVAVPSHELGELRGSGAAGSRTRVPRSRRCGLYVRRSWIISGTVLLDQTASVSHTVSDVPAALDGRSQRVEPGHVDPLPLPGVGGGSSQVFKLREPDHRWHLEVPDVGLTRSRQAPSARSHHDGLTTVETMSAPCLGGASTLCGCQGSGCSGPDIVRHGVKGGPESADLPPSFHRQVATRT
jgi:hypothetical protein